MHGFLGVPILLRGRAYGNLYLTEKAEGPFTAEDQELVETLASQAAVAIENARLYEEATNRSAQLEALNEVGTALAGEIELPRLLQLICRHLRGLIRARVVTIALPASDGTLRIEAADGQGADELLGVQLERAGSKSGRVLERRRGERVDSLADDSEVDHEATRPLGVQAGLYVPLIAAGRAIGVIGAHDKEGDDPRFATSTSASRRPLPSAPPLPSTFRHGWRATPCGEWWRRRSSSVAGWRVSSMTRPARS